MERVGWLVAVTWGMVVEAKAKVVVRVVAEAAIEVAGVMTATTRAKRGRELMPQRRKRRRKWRVITLFHGTTFQAAWRAFHRVDLYCGLPLRVFDLGNNTS